MQRRVRTERNKPNVLALISSVMMIGRTSLVSKAVTIKVVSAIGRNR
jgi:hypothetical protein